MKMSKEHVSVVFFLSVFGLAFQSKISTLIIPKTWDIREIIRFHLHAPDSSAEIEFATEKYYYSLPEHVIYKSYPVYVREFEKEGYLDSLRSLEPEVVFDFNKIKTQEDWVEAGKMVFHWPVASYREIKDTASHLSVAAFQNGTGNFSLDGVYPANRYIISEKGKIVLGSLSCASCHTRVMPNGETIDGAQGNTFNLTGFATSIESGRIPFPALQQSIDQLTFVPWAPTANKQTLNKDEYVRYLKNLPKGMSDRQGMAYSHPLTIPSLIGIKDIKYLDHTGIMRHENAGDLMRYAAFNQGMDMLTSYNRYIPIGAKNNSEFTKADQWRHPFGYLARRYSDAQLYALTQYLYSLKPPVNPNKLDKTLIKEGSIAFQKASCVTCHTPPLFTNNKLTPVNGFDPPADHLKRYDIFNISVETDSVTALYSRRATGYYKIPSLRGLWYRNVFFHGGHLTALEEVLSAKRLQNDFVPSGYMPPNVKSMAVKGHPFGLELSDQEKKALIAYLKSI